MYGNDKSQLKGERTMKKKFKNKLAINKRTISNLDGESLNRIKGGATGVMTCESFCWTCTETTCFDCGPERTLESDCYCPTAFTECYCEETEHCLTDYRCYTDYC